MQSRALIVDLFRSMLETPFGPMQIAVDPDGVLVEVWLPHHCGHGAETRGAPTRAAREGSREARTQLGEYFSRKRHDFDLRLNPRGSPFERVVWDRLLAIPYGATTSYGAIAGELGLTNGARAVGRANGANPIPIVIPCHRVIGADGRLTGYGGGLPLKRALLALEGAVSNDEFHLARSAVGSRHPNL
jgi:methylated-DNA-[protein]-cysteine S-methyltransferase